jgi:hypothetical protein
MNFTLNPRSLFETVSLRSLYVVRCILQIATAIYSKRGRDNLRRARRGKPAGALSGTDECRAAGEGGRSPSLSGSGGGEEREASSEHSHVRHGL